MAGADIIREFLVGLSYKIDVGSENKMRESLATMANSVVQLGKAVDEVATKVISSVAKIAEKAEDLYWASGRLHSSVQQINAFTYAIGQMGGSGAAARQSLEGLASFMRSSPGAGGVLVGLGINPAALKDTVLLTTELEKKFAAFAQHGQYYRAKAYASFMGIDELTLQAMIRDAGKFGTEYTQMVKAVGLNQQQASNDATFFMQRLRALGAALDIVAEKAASKLYVGLGNDLERLRQFIIRNSDAIVRAIEFTTRVILTLAEVLVRYIGRGIEIFEKLHAAFERLPPNMRKIIEYTLGIAAAWRIFSNLLTLSPIGIVLRIAAALVALYDDYETWKEGGKSLIDWAKWEPDIQKALAAIQWIIDKIGELTKGMNDWQLLGVAVLTFFTGRFLTGILGAFTSIPGAIAKAVAGSVGEIAGMGEGVLGIAARWGTGFVARFMGPIGAAVIALNPTSTQTDAQEAATPGYADRFRAQGPQPGINPAAISKVPESMVGSLAHAATGFMNPYMGGFMNRVGMSGWGGVGLAAKTKEMQGVVDFFKNKGWSAAQAAGIAANLYQESKLDPNASGDGGLAYGVGQWHPDRQMAFQRLFGHDIRGSSLEEQLAFYDWELHNTESKAGGNLGRANTPEAAAIAVEGAERPAGWSENNAGPQGPIRAAAASAIYSATAGAAPLASANAGQRNGGGDGATSATINQTNNITMHTDDGALARKLTGALTRTNADLVRNTQGAVQ